MTHAVTSAPGSLRLGVVNQETWDFLAPLFSHFTQRYRTAVFNRRTIGLPIFNTRVNRSLLHHDLRTFMRANDVVFFEWASELLATATHLPKVTRLVVRLHRYELYEWADRIDWGPVDQIVLVSEAKRREFAARFPQHAAKVVVSYPSVSLDRFRPAEPERSFAGDIGILCHLTARKRVYDLILTFAELIEDGHDFRLHIGGSCRPGYDDYHLALQRLVAELRLRDRVTFYGYVAETPAWYRQIDVFVSNSYSEGLQVAAIEAMASGCYCLVHRWDGAEELLPSRDLFSTGRELREKIVVYARAPAEQQREHRARMRRIACDRFDLRHATEEICHAIERAAAIGRPRSVAR